MKKKIIIGLAITATLIYFEISCGKKEFANNLFDSINATNLVNPEYRLSAEVIKESDKTIYDIKFTSAFTIIAEIDNNIKKGTLNAALNMLGEDNKIIFRDIQRQTLKSNNFDNLLIDIIAPNKINSIIDIQKAVRNDPKLTYSQLVKRLEHLSTNINTLKNIILNCINAINNSPMDANAKSALLHGSSSDPRIEFLGFQTIYNKFITLKFELTQ
ncbi:hypothetical protein [Spirobacillus cienkowskii]|uniref:hypothetical protein n=1 Tax=Spirobacillus cienkowskii TaxID=495820 RepID=UPI0030D4C6DD